MNKVKFLTTVIAMLVMASFASAQSNSKSKNSTASDTTLEELKRSWQLWNDDWTKLESHYADSIVSEEPGSGSPPWRGKAAVMGLADDLIWSELAMPEDMNKTTALAAFKEFWKSFSDVKLATTSLWAAGNYVVALGVVEGTNDGDLTMMNLKATNKRLSLPYAEISKFKDGKLVANWLFYDGLGFTSQLGLGR